MTKTKPVSPTAPSWSIVLEDKDTGDQRVIAYNYAFAQPEAGADLFLCDLEGEYEVTPNDFGTPCV